MSKMRVKLTLSTLAVVAVGLVAVALVVESAFSDAHRVLEQALETRGGAYATQLANELSFAVAASARDEIESSLSAFQDSHDDNIGLTVTGADNSVLVTIGREFPPELVTSLAKPAAVATSRGDYIYSAAPITSEGRKLGHVYCLEEQPTAGELRDRSRMICLLTYLVVLLLIGAGVYYIGSRLSAPLENMVSIARSVASGDLTQPPLKTGGRDESAKLGAAIDQMADALRIQVGAIKNVASDVLGNSSQVTSASSQLASAASEQASAIAQTTSTIEEIKQAGQLAKQSAGQIVNNSEKSVEVSGEGLTAVEASTSEVESIRAQVETIAAGIEGLRSQVGEVGEIITLVNQVAEQSNLLAVNASIEAAKAGESGRGFAVVAQEVKSLAAQSKQATAQVRNTLGNIQDAIEQVFSTARAGRERTEAGVQSIKNTGAVIRRLSEIISDTSESAKRIAISANEQVVGLEQVAQAMTSVNQAANDNLVSTQQVEQGSESLTTMARELEQLIAAYQTAD